MTDRDLRDALHESSRRRAAAPDLKTVLDFEPPRRRPRTAPIAAALVLAIGAASWFSLEAPPPAQPSDYAVALPEYTASLADPFERARLPSTASLIPKIAERSL